MVEGGYQGFAAAQGIADPVLDFVAAAPIAGKE